VNGRVSLFDGGFDVQVRETYGNCRQYIQSREYLPDRDGGAAASTAGDRLSAAQQERIRRADTFFIATHAPGIGADASHRGGRPGFVEVSDPHTLCFPDYPGNNFFNTLGNLEMDPHAGLLFVDFEGGDVLQLSGAARVLWDKSLAARYPGAQRLVRFDIARTIDRPGASPLRMRLLEYSPFNP
jgi:predicted pyridoxine 5'-phosphate oxidase superfamily flavin-nucleotide-binding protein